LAGTYGTETSDCDTPHALVNATFKWIAENVRDVDFVVWTGDSARHDSDEKIPRTADEVLSTNRWIAEKFQEVFRHDDSNKGLAVPIVSTFGNNDILPHNILLSGPNKWLKTYTDIWREFIPEEQRHGFERGGWYYVEVIPGKLAVFSLNTLYFFKQNAGVDGCALRSEPGFEHMEWLRIQLQFMRDRGMKAILMGHVPPARTDSKQLWDETCWQKYTLWLQQYRDVIVGGLYGHMNIDHFMLQDHKQVNLLSEDDVSTESVIRATMEEELSIESANDYLEELREDWSGLPNPAAAIKEAKDNVPEDSKKKKKKKKKGKKDKKKSKKDKKKDKTLKKIGGPWGERYSITLVSPSLVPNFFPTLRVVEYNITGLDATATWASTRSGILTEKKDWLDEEEQSSNQDDDEASIEKKKKGKKHKKKKKKKPKVPDFVVPLPPSKSSPPGPAYSPQTLTLLGYTQYFANLTHINNDAAIAPEMLEFEDELDADKWRPGKHQGKNPKHKPHPKTFEYQVEYDTFTDPIYKLKDLTMRSYLKLAHRIGQYKPAKGDSIEDLEDETIDDASDDSDDDSEDETISDTSDDIDNGSDDEVEVDKKKKKKKKHKKKKHHKRHEKNKVWLRFVKRAFVGTLEEEDLRTFNEDEVLIPEFREEL
jgi:endopolyphosphatase